MPYSTGCKTPLSNFEANSNYKDVSDPEIMVSFPIIGDPDDAALVAWTTTPWALPSNLCLCVNAKFDYVKVRNKMFGLVYVVDKCRLSELPRDVKKSKADGRKAPNQDSKNAKGSSSGKVEIKVDSGPYELLETMTGASLVHPLFDYFADFSDSAFRVVAENYVTYDSGTGVVHCAPAFGEEDYRACIANHIIQKGENLIVPVDDDGRFTDRALWFYFHSCGLSRWVCKFCKHRQIQKGNHFGL
ncbi:hypothetical protein MKW94_000363, partial [Papaver nudicaule]|nr:hypothetical protein [Papaver nudicaule]